MGEKFEHFASAGIATIEVSGDKSIDGYLRPILDQANSSPPAKTESQNIKSHQEGIVPPANKIS